MTQNGDFDPISEEDMRRKAQKRRNAWLALALFAFVIIVGATTMIRLGDADLGPDGGLYWRNDPETPQPSPPPDLPSEFQPQEEGADE